MARSHKVKIGETEYSESDSISLSYAYTKSGDWQYYPAWEVIPSDKTSVQFERFEYSTLDLKRDMEEFLTVAHSTDAKLDEIKDGQDRMARMLRRVQEHLGIEEDEDAIELRNVSDEEATQLIEEYMREHGRAWPQDVAEDLRLPFAQVMKITTMLMKKGVLEEIGEEQE